MDPSSKTQAPETEAARPLGWGDRGLAVLSGLLFVLSAPPYDVSVLGFVSVAVLWFVLDGVRMRRRPLRSAFAVGWFAGLAAALAGFYWIVGLLDRFARLPIVVCVLFYLLLCAWSAVCWGLACLAARAMDARGWSALLVLPASFAAAECFFPQMFPWPVALSQYRSPLLIQTADLGGPYLVTFLVVVVGVCLAEAARGRRRTLLGAGVALLAAVGYGAMRMGTVDAARERAPRRTVALLQPNISIEDKHDPRMRRSNLRRLQALSAEAERRGADLIVWPESSYPYPVGRDPARMRRVGRSVRSGFSADLLFGAVSEAGDDRWNSAFLLTEDGRVLGPADKRVLLAFGEYIPLYEYLPFVRRAFPRSGGFKRAARPGILDDGHVRIAVMNCYEDALPEMSPYLADGEPHLLVNVTNDAWFGDSSEPHQHAALAVFRSVELRRDLARSVNTGVSSFIDAVGRIRKEAPTFQERILTDEVALLEGRTVYGTVGDVFAWICLAGIVVSLAWRRLADC